MVTALVLAPAHNHLAVVDIAGLIGQHCHGKTEGHICFEGVDELRGHHMDPLVMRLHPIEVNGRKGPMRLSGVGVVATPCPGTPREETPSLLLIVLTLIQDTVVVAVGAVAPRGPPHAPLPTRRSLIATDIRGCAKGLESDRAAALALAPRSTPRSARLLVAVTLELNDPGQNERMAVRRRPTCFLGRDRRVGCIYPTFRWRVQRAAVQETVGEETIYMRTVAAAPQPRLVLATRCTQFKGGAVRLGPRQRRQVWTWTRGTRMATVQLEGPPRGLGPSRMQRGSEPCLAWRRGTRTS